MSVFSDMPGTLLSGLEIILIAIIFQCFITSVPVMAFQEYIRGIA
jgi:hypothetical protein